MQVTLAKQVFTDITRVQISLSHTMHFFSSRFDSNLPHCLALLVSRGEAEPALLYLSLKKDIIAPDGRQQRPRREVKCTYTLRRPASYLCVHSSCSIHLPRVPLRLLAALHKPEIIKLLEVLRSISLSRREVIKIERRLLGSHQSGDVQALWRELRDPAIGTILEGTTTACTTVCARKVHFDVLHLPLELVQSNLYIVSVLFGLVVMPLSHHVASPLNCQV
jgi:hypothetical protein